MAEMVKNQSAKNFTVTDYAISFVYGMGTEQRKRFKEMLNNGFDCGKSVALNYGVNYDELMTEVKRILNVEEK